MQVCVCVRVRVLGGALSSDRGLPSSHFRVPQTVLHVCVCLVTAAFCEGGSSRINLSAPNALTGLCFWESDFPLPTLLLPFPPVPPPLVTTGASGKIKLGLSDVDQAVLPGCYGNSDFAACTSREQEGGGPPPAAPRLNPTDRKSVV